MTRSAARACRSGVPGLLRTLVVLVLAAACGGPRHDVAGVFGGAAALAVLDAPAAGQAWRLDPEHRGAQPQEPEPGGYPTLAGPVELDPELARRVGATLADPRTYRWGGAAKACAPRYGLRFRLARDGATLDVVVCLECSLLLAYRDGDFQGSGHVDPGRRALARLALEAFPGEAGFERWAEGP